MTITKSGAAHPPASSSTPDGRQKVAHGSLTAAPRWFAPSRRWILMPLRGWALVDPTDSRLAPRAVFFRPSGAWFACVYALLILAVGCDRGGTAAEDHDPDHAGHAHGADVAKGGERPENDHDHDHDHAHDHADEVVLTLQAIRANGIRIARAKRQTLNATLVAPARITYNAEQVAHVNAPVAGRVVEVEVRAGDSVKAGDALLLVDSTELGEAQSDYLQKQTMVETTKAAMEIAKAAHERSQQLERSQNITRTEVEKRLGELQAAQGAARTATAALTAAASRLQLLGMTKQAIASLARTGEVDTKYTVTSPIAGRVVEREVTLGELVGPERERKSLVRVANLNPIWVVVDVPEAQLGAAPVGSKAKVEVPAIGQTFDGTVTYVAPELDESTRTARARVEVANEPPKLLPGMFARVEISDGADAESAEPVIAVRDEAVQTVEGEPSVFVPVEGEPNTFARRAVGVGPAVGGMVPVYAGLKEGERYVVSGSFVLKAELGKAGAAHQH